MDDVLAMSASMEEVSKPTTPMKGWRPPLFYTLQPTGGKKNLLPAAWLGCDPLPTHGTRSAAFGALANRPSTESRETTPKEFLRWT